MPNPHQTRAWTWLVDLLAEEAGAAQFSSDLLHELDQHAGYHLCDEVAVLMPFEAARRSLVDDILARAGPSSDLAPAPAKLFA